MKTGWHRVNFTVISACLLVFLATVASADILLPKGTELQIVFEKDVSSGSFEVEDEVPIRLQGAIDVGGLILVKDGAKGTATIKSVKPAGRFGKPGMIEVELVGLEPNDSYNAADDKKIALIAASETESFIANGKGRKTLSYIVFFGLIIKGTQGVIPADEPYTAKIAEDIFIVLE